MIIQQLCKCQKTHAEIEKIIAEAVALGTVIFRRVSVQHRHTIQQPTNMMSQKKIKQRETVITLGVNGRIMQTILQQRERVAILQV